MWNRRALLKTGNMKDYLSKLKNIQRSVIIISLNESWNFTSLPCLTLGGCLKFLLNFFRRINLKKRLKSTYGIAFGLGCYCWQWSTIAGMGICSWAWNIGCSRRRSIQKYEIINMKLTWGRCFQRIWRFKFFIIEIRFILPFGRGPVARLQNISDQ